MPCYIRGCRSRGSVRRLPKDEPRRLLWLQFCKSEKCWQKRICNKHFSDEQFYSAGGKRFLKHDAVPDQYLPRSARTVECPGSAGAATASLPPANAQQQQAQLQPQPQQPPQQQPQQPPQQHQSRMQQHPIEIWEGTLQWSEKKLGEANKQVHPIPCQLICSVNANGEPEVKADNWPNKLMLQLVNRSVISSIGKSYFENIRSVKFNLQPYEPLDRLSQIMRNGNTGIVYFSSVTPATDVKVMVLLYAAEKQTYFGFIPDDQNGFIVRLKEVMTQQKQLLIQQRLNRRQQMMQRAQGSIGSMIPDQLPPKLGQMDGTDTHDFLSWSATLVSLAVSLDAKYRFICKNRRSRLVRNNTTTRSM